MKYKKINKASKKWVPCVVRFYVGEPKNNQENEMHINETTEFHSNSFMETGEKGKSTEQSH